MLKAIVAALAIAASAAVVILAAANRQPVAVTLAPFSGESGTVTLPLYVLVFIAAALGVVGGGIATWFSQRPARRAARARRREITRLERELAAARLGTVALPPPARR